MRVGTNLLLVSTAFVFIPGLRDSWVLPKWLWTWFLLIGFSLTGTKVRIPELRRGEWFCVVACAASLVFQILIWPSPVWWTELSSFGLAVGAVGLGLQGFGNSNLLESPFMLWGGLALAALPWLSGHEAIFAMMCGLAFIAVLRQKRSPLRMLSLVGLAGAILLSKNRTTLLGLVVALALEFRATIRYAILAFGISALASLTHFLPVKTEGIFGRLDVWRATIGLIRDHPMGIGPGRFQFEILPYLEEGRRSETLLFSHPHLELLDLAARHGIVSGLALVILVGLVLLPRVRGSKLRTQIAAFLAVQSLFYFPFSYALPWLILWLGFGLSLRVRRSKREIPAWFFAVLLIGSGLPLALEFFENKRGLTSRQGEVICRMSPLRSYACAVSVEGDLLDGEYRLAEQKAGRTLAVNPRDFVALRQEYRAQRALGDPRAKDTLKKIEEIFGEGKGAGKAVGERGGPIH